jgi:(p)ppGpp synthase/HD superfamily hydrolase
MPSPWSQEKYIKTYSFAAAALKNPFPGTDLPFTIHISLVAMEVMATLQAESGFDGDLAVQCALLHDVIDYSSTTEEDIKNEFGIKVARGVRALSRPNGVPEAQKLAQSLSLIQQQPPDIWIVKMADKITSLVSPPSYWTAKIMESYRRDSRQTYDTLKGASAFMAARLLEQIENSKKFLGH